jgi:pimeloyl-ACP methyl ester carboxylesterase
MATDISTALRFRFYFYILLLQPMNMRILSVFFLVIFSFSVIHLGAQVPPLKFDIAYGTNQAVGKYAEVNGIKMYYEEYGQGKPLVLIHGNGGSILHMGYQIQYFSKYYRCIVADSRAHGKSAVGNGRLTYEVMADDWAALLDHLKIDSAYVLGWSDGGILGLLLAIHHPKKVSKLAAMGANLQPDSSAVYSWVVPILENMNKLTDSMISAKNKSQNWDVMKKHLDLLSNQPHIPLQELHKIACPVLVMGGDKDVIREEHTTEIYQNIPKAHLCIFPGETHMIPVTDPDLFNATVSRFLKNPFKRPDTKDFFQ